MIKNLTGAIRQYKKASILTPLLVSGEILIEIVVPLIMASLIDRGINTGDMSEVLRFSLYLGCFVAGQLFFGMMAARMGAYASAGFASNLRSDIFKKVQSFSFSNIDRFSTASIITRLTTDITNIQFAYQIFLRIFFRAPLMMTFALIVSFRIDRDISMVFLAFVPFLAIGLGMLFKTSYPIFDRVFKNYDRLNNVVQENVKGIRVVKSFDRADYEETKFQKISSLIYKEYSKAEKILAFNSPVMLITSYGYIITIAWLGAKAIIASGNNIALGLTTGQLLSLFIYAQQILISLMLISMLFVILAVSRASMRRIVEVLREESDIMNPADPIYEVKDGEIIFTDVNFTYGHDREKVDKNVLENINLKINSGETVGILGATGSSKSSLVQLIPRIYDVTEGSVRVGGHDVRDYDIRALREAVALVLQKNVLFSGTIRDNLLWGNRSATQEEIEEACRLAKADKFIEAMSDRYDSVIEKEGANVSGGQKQRLCIARALLKKPKILILDDSTSAVDTKTDAEIQENLAAYMPDTTKIIIAQRVSSVCNADKILIMEDGKITDMGTHDELLERNEIYKVLYESQQKGEAEDE